MEFNHKITIKNFGVIEVCFRKKGIFSNVGKIIVDSDTYDFAGILTEDIIVAYFKENHYEVFCKMISYNITTDSITHLAQHVGYKINREYMQFYVPFQKTDDILKDFSTGFLVDYDNSEYELKFGTFIENQNIVKKVLNKYVDMGIIVTR